MTPLLQRPRKRLPGPMLLVAALVLVALVVAGAVIARGGMDRLADLVHEAGRPLWQIGERGLAAVHVVYRTTESKESLVAENESLHEELSRLRRVAFQVDILEAENRKLKELLNRPERGSTLLASVLRDTSSSPYDSLVIDVGSAAGLRGGELVRAPGGIAIGRVRRVFSETSVVLLLSAYGEELEVIIGHATTTHVTAHGEGGGMFSISVPRSVLVEEGALVRVPSLTGEITGTIEEVVADDSQAFTRAYFRTPVNFSSLRFVEVLEGISWQAPANAEAVSEESSPDAIRSEP